MMQHKKETGTEKDLVLYRIQTSRDNLKSARIFRQKNTKEQITVHTLCASYCAELSFL